jgi:protein-S-isoprenylcysteine O-methyltransferase Ste14
MNNLTVRAARGIGQLAIAMAAFLFIPAQTLEFWQAWVFLAVFFVAAIAITLYLMKNDKALLERRISAGPSVEKENSQKIITSFTSIGFVALILVPAIDHRLGWSRVPTSIVLLGDFLVALGFLVVFFVFKENTFTASTVEIMKDQEVISTGPYAIVRHPMYLGGFLLLLGTPLALGSYWGLLALAGMMPFLLWRTFDEESLLSENLPGYLEYKSKVRSRLIPGIF